MRCRGSWLPLRDAALLPPRVLFHLQLGRAQGWQWELRGQWGGQVPAFVTCSPRHVGGAAGGTAENRLLWVGFFGRVASGPSPLGAPRMRKHGDSSASPRAFPPSQLKCLLARLKGSPGTGTWCVQQPLECWLSLLSASL